MPNDKKPLSKLPHYRCDPRLREIMTAPPMSAEAHAAERQRQLAVRRKIEDLHEERADAAQRWG